MFWTMDWTVYCNFVIYKTSTVFNFNKYKIFYSVNLITPLPVFCQLGDTDEYSRKTDGLLSRGSPKTYSYRVCSCYSVRRMISEWLNPGRGIVEETKYSSLCHQFSPADGHFMLTKSHKSFAEPWCSCTQFLSLFFIFLPPGDFYIVYFFIRWNTKPWKIEREI